MPEVVFFVGPPFSGKTLYFLKVMSITHERICPEELFHANPTLSLRSVILKVVKTLKKGKNVAVDGEAISRKTRASYISLIKLKVPDCSLRCLLFKVHLAEARLQCSWACEWELGRQFGLEEQWLGFHSTPTLNAKLDIWLNQRETDFPIGEEGFNSISEVAARLICDSPYEFDLPALFIQWAGILERAEHSVMCRPGVIDVITKWCENNPPGRVIVVSDGMHTCNDSGIGSHARATRDACTCLEDIKRVMRQATSKLPVPLFFVRLESPSLSGQFSQPPSPGLLAWIQRIHNIDLTHRATLYIHSTETHRKAATSAGIKVLRATEIFGNPSMINAVNCGLATLVPDCVRNACVASFGYTAHTDVTAAPRMDTSPSLPLFQQAMKSPDSESIDAGSCCVLMSKAGRVHGVCYRDKATLQSYQLLFQRSATPSKPASAIKLERKLIWIASQSQSEAPKKDGLNRVGPSARSEAITGGPKPTSKSPLVVSLQEEDIARLAYSPGHFQRGRGCKKAVQDFTTSAEAEGTRIKCNCKGSFGSLYELSAVLGQSGIITARCSCPDPAGKLGKCKHVVAMMMTFIDKATRLKEREPSKSRRKVRATSELGSDGRRTRQKKLADETIYCMSPEELMTTAQEILNEKSSTIIETIKATKKVEGKAEQGEDCEHESAGLRKRRLVNCSLKDLIDEDIPASSKVLCKKSQPVKGYEDVRGASVSDTCQSTSKPVVTTVSECLVLDTASVIPETAVMTNPGSPGHQQCMKSIIDPTSNPQPGSSFGRGHRDAKGKKMKERPSVLDEFI